VAFSVRLFGEIKIYMDNTVCLYPSLCLLQLSHYELTNGVWRVVHLKLNLADFSRYIWRPWWYSRKLCRPKLVQMWHKCTVHPFQKVGAVRTHWTPPPSPFHLEMMLVSIVMVQHQQ